MKTLIGYTLLILFHINQSAATSSHNAANDEIDLTIATGECLNNSIDSKCSVLPTKVRGPSYEVEHEQSRNAHLDGPMDLMNRLQNIDQLDVQASAFNSSHRWITTPPEPSLRQVLIVHRHGDRTPIQFPPKDPLADEPFWPFHGYGQLTNRGKARLYLLGHMMRQRYDNFLRGSVNKNQRVSRSSGSLRCIESAQVFLSSFLELDLPSSLDAPMLTWSTNRDEQLGRLWQPANIQAVPASIDGMLAESAECKNLMDEYLNVIDKSEEVQKIHEEYKHEADVLKRVLGFEVDHFYKWFWGSSQIEVEKSYFADKMNPEILNIYERVQEAGNRAMGSYISTFTTKQLRSGLLINDIIENMDNYRKQHHLLGSDNPAVKKFIHYSGHDLTLVVLLGMMDAWTKTTTRPEYASSIIIELHQEISEWYLKIYYLPQVPAEPVELHMEACEKDHPKKRCTLDKFAKLMSAYRISDWQTWMEACANDLHKINPYIMGR